jgi:hypothetical protein
LTETLGKLESGKVSQMATVLNNLSLSPSASDILDKLSKLLTIYGEVQSGLATKTGKLTLETMEVVFHEPLTDSAILNTKTPGRIVGAWYCPIDNLGDFVGMHAIRVTVVDDSHVKLDWEQTRVVFLRVQVCALIAGG